MINGRVIIDFEYDGESKCTWDIQQTGKNTLDKENLVFLFKHIVGELLNRE